MPDRQNSVCPPPPFYRFDPLVPILFVALIFFLTFLARVMLSPLMPGVIAEMGITPAQAGTLFLIMSIGYFAALLGSGFISARILHRRTIVLSSCSTGAALLLIAFSHHLWHLQVSAFILGMATGVYLPSGITALTGMVDPRHWGKAVSIHELAPNLAFMAAPLIAEIFLRSYSWRAMPAAVGAIAICVGLGFAFAGKGGDFPGRRPSAVAFRTLAGDRFFWMMVLLFGLAISSTMGIYTMLPLFLVNEAGLERNFANTLLAFSRAPGLAMALIAGWASDYFGPRRTIIVVLGITGIATILMGVCHHPVLLAGIVVLQATISTGFFPAGFALLSAITPAEHRNVAVSLAVPIAFVYGGGITPALIGMTGDAGSFAAGIMITGILICFGSCLPVVLRR